MAPKLAESKHSLISDMLRSKSLIREHLLEKPHIYQDEIVLFLQDEFDLQVLTQECREGSKIYRVDKEKRYAA